MARKISMGDKVGGLWGQFIASLAKFNPQAVSLTIKTLDKNTCTHGDLLEKYSELLLITA